MKAFIFALALLPGLANAHGAAVTCKTQGSLSEIDLLIESSGSLTDAFSRITVQSSGLRPMTFVTAASLISNADGVVKVDIKELAANDGIKQGGAQAILSLNTKTITASVLVPEGNGTLEITQSPVERPGMIGGTYVLTECNGVL